MCFRSLNKSFLMVVLIFVNVFCVVLSVKWNGVHSANGTIFQYQDIYECKHNEFYDLDYFTCVACSTDDGNLQPTENKFACQCIESKSLFALYDNNKERPICVTNTVKCDENAGSSTTILPHDNSCIQIEEENETRNESNCQLQYVNQTNDGDLEWKQFNIRIMRLKQSNFSNCYCDLKYNFHYQDYCIVNQLMKPYLHYNSFWQPVKGTVTGHFGDLKFVAFFCLRMRNVTACNHLANLCIKSHYSFDKNSPCSAFLLTQASDVAFKLGANMDEPLRSMRPFLFFKKGQQTVEFHSQPVMNSSGYSLHNSHINIFSTHYALDGSLKRRGVFHFDYINLCGVSVLDLSQQKIIFGRRIKPLKCLVSLENLIDFDQVGWKSDFISLFLNYSSTTLPQKNLMHAMPILIENLTPENERDEPSHWLLVKRFQMINAQKRFHLGPQKPIYEDTQKLQFYRSLRFVTKFELHYKVYARNRISVPLVRLRYRHFEIHANASLTQLFPFNMEITFGKSEEDSSSSQYAVLNEIILPMLLLIVITISLLRSHNYRKRHRSTILTNSAEKPQSVSMDLCDFYSLLEFLVQLCSNLSHAFLIFFLLYVIYDSTLFFTQKEVTVTLPLMKEDSTEFEILIYMALFLKFFFYCIHLWRCTHFDIFFIDWERPKSYDNNHFNLKSNLETSSVCSSVRTFVSENNVSAWRIFFTANEWIRLSTKQKTSSFVQCLGLLVLYKLFEFSDMMQEDLMLKLNFIIIVYVGIYCVQLLYQYIVTNYITGDPLKKFIDLCSWANVSIFILLEPSYGFYIHGRSPHGFADTDMSSMIVQLQRESHSICGRRGLLNDSDQQTYIILPPTNLRTYFQRLLIPFQRSYSISQAHYQKETISLGFVGGVDGNLERTFIAYSSINRFFCAFIDHAIKDMDYIIKEKTFIERFLDCEFENYLTENKGTFYIDNGNSFSKIFLYGNERHTFVIEFLLLLALFMLTYNLILTLVIVCLFKALVQRIISSCMRHNVSKKTLINKRFLL